MLKVVIRAGKNENWQNPKRPKPTLRNKYVPIPGFTAKDSPWTKEMIGIRLNAREVGMAVFKQTKVRFLSF